MRNVNDPAAFSHRMVEADEVGNRTCHVFDWHLRVDAVLIEQIDPIGPQAFQHVIDDDFDVLRPAVEARAALTSLLVDVPAKLRCDHYLVAKRCDRFRNTAQVMWTW